LRATGTVELRAQLKERLLAQGEKILLRVVMSPDFDRPTEFTGKALVERAEEIVRSIHLAKKRSVVLLLLPHSPELFLLQLGLVLAGHIPAILAWPTSRVDAEKYQRNLVHQLVHLPADQLITLPRLAKNLSESLPCAVSGVHLGNEANFEKQFSAAPVNERLERQGVLGVVAQPGDDALFLQFSGGTTGAQKAIVVTAATLSEQLKLLANALKFASEDGVVSWLPLYHDMGLIACYWMPLWHGASSVQMAASDWVINPELLLKYICRYRATFCWLPNFSFSYISQRREQMRQKYGLESVRAWINCSEPVRLRSIEEFAGTFASWGVKKESLQASYAMAETVFAITQSELGKQLSRVPRSEVNQGIRSNGKLAFDLIDDVYVSSGKPLSNTEVRIAGADGSECAEAVAGEIHVRTSSLFAGYWGVAGFQAHTLNNGWHATGDYGFVMNGELFVIGRLKDIVIVGGNNIFPEDVEAAVNGIDGVYTGRVVAFGVEDREYGTQGLAVVAEVKGDFKEEEASELETSIRKLVLTTVGTAPRYVAVVPHRWIVKSTAGKISRRETREKYLRERLKTSSMEGELLPDSETIRSAAREAASQIARRPILEGERLVTSGLIDSLSVLRLISLLESKLCVSISPETLQPEDFDDVELIVETVERMAKPKT
jgi:fatty-acyl-CoA synthase